MAFKTNWNKPKVKIVKGKVNNTKTGFKNVLTTPRRIATTTAVAESLIKTPGKIYPAT